MGYYKHETAEKTYKRFSEITESTIDADLELAPSVDYSRDEVYKINGVGSMFNGTYRFRKISIMISTSGITVNASARMIYDAFGNFVEDGYQKGEEVKDTKTKASTKSKSDTTHTVKEGETLWSIAKKITGNPLDWKDIEDANIAQLKARDKRATDEGHWVFAGQVLKIPGHIL